MKYDIIISEGCTAFYTSINGKVIGDEYEPTRFPDNEVDELVDYLCAKFKEELRQSTVLLNDLIQCFQPDECSYDSEPCDQCGDSVNTRTWKL